MRPRQHRQVAITLSFIFTGWHSAPALPVSRGPAPPGVAAVVNGQIITSSQVEEEAVKKYGPQAMQRLIVDVLVDQEAKKEGLTPTDADIAAEVDRQRRQAMLRTPGVPFTDLLARSNMTMATFKWDVRLELEAGNLVSKHIKPTTMVHVEHLFVSTQPSNDPYAKPPHTDAEALAIIAEAQADLKAGKSWDEVVKVYSEDTPTRTNGGDLGIIYPKSMPDPMIIHAALALKPGEISEPVKSQSGYHLIRVVSTSTNSSLAELGRYAQAEQEYKKQMQREMMPAYLRQLQASAHVVNYIAP